MQIQVCNHSSYPDGGAGRSAVAAQTELGLDWVSVQPPAGADNITGLVGRLAGACLGDEVALSFRPGRCKQLRIQARLRNRERFLKSVVEAAGPETAVPLKIAITGPYTLSRLSRLETTAYRNLDHLAEDIATHLAEELRDAVDAGVRLVQIDEPSILQSPADIRLLREVLEPLQEAVDPAATLLVATYGGRVGELFAHLNSLPGSAVGLDCLSSPELIEDLHATGSGKPLALGLIGPDDPSAADDIARRVDRATRRYVHETLYLQPACGLGLIPEPAARKLLRTLLQARDLVRGRTDH